MAGILDFLNQPDAQLGIGLLAAGGPTTDPNRTGLGQRIAGAVQGVTANQSAMTDVQLKKAQLADELQKTAVNAYQLKRLQDWQSLVNGDAGTGASPAATAQGAGVTPPQSTAPQGAMPAQGMTPQGSPQGPQGAPMQGAPVQAPRPGFAYALPGFGDQQSRAIAGIMQPADYMKLYADKAGPQTDIAKLMFQTGIDPNSTLGRQITQQQIAKLNYIPPVSGRPGGYLANADGTIKQLPHVPDGFTAVDNGQGGFAIVPVQGGLAAMQAGAKATAAGKGDIATKQVWDPNYTDPATGKKGGYVEQTQTNIANSANGGAVPDATLGMRNNNPGNLRPPGASTGFQQFATPQEGLAALDQNLQSYGNKGINTIQGVISRWAPSSENDTNGYVQSVSKRLGIAPNAQIDLSNPITRQMIGTAIMLQENGSRILTGGGAAPAAAVAPAGPLASQPPLGTTKNADTASNASAQTMHDSYARLQTTNSTTNSALDAIEKMQGLAAKKNPLLTAGPLGTAQTPLNADAAEYEKQRANLNILMANQSGTGGTDAGRALTGDSIPDFGKPRPAIKDGLETLKNQLTAQQLKTQFLTPTYQAGDSKAYTAKENEFDQNVSPSMIPLITMPPGQSRAMLLQSLRKKPGMEAKLNWAAENGLLK